MDLLSLFRDSEWLCYWQKSLIFLKWLLMSLLLLWAFSSCVNLIFNKACGENAVHTAARNEFRKGQTSL